MLAILYDIHGNRPALEAVLAHAREQDADRWLLGGDYAAFGAWPAECVALLRELGDDATWIRGNWERWQVEPDAVPDAEVVRSAAASVLQVLGPQRVAELGALPAAATIGDTLFVHASPPSDIESFLPDADPEEDDQLLAGVQQRRLVFGHTHLQFRRRSAGGIELVNPGSVGLPWDGDVRAAYATVSDDGELVLHRVEYDVDAAAWALEELDEPWAATTVARLRQARFEV
jgi:diadenosine tetraphosphatase ApaH/serine/threonine PP2A family protein phosphatase